MTGIPEGSASAVASEASATLASTAAAEATEAAEGATPATEEAIASKAVKPPPSSSSMSPGLRVVSAVPGENEREELLDRLEQSLGYSTCRLPRVLAVAAQRRRQAGMVKQWSMDETKSWFYARSSSLDRTNRQQQMVNPAAATTADHETADPAAVSAQMKQSSAAAERRRKFFQRKNTSSAPASSTESMDVDALPPPAANSAAFGSSVVGGAVSRALEEVFRTSTLLPWDSIDLSSAATSSSSEALGLGGGGSGLSSGVQQQQQQQRPSVNKPSNLFLGQAIAEEDKSGKIR